MGLPELSIGNDALVKVNAGACVVDAITIERFDKDSQIRLLAVKEQLKRGDYQPKPVKRVWIDKPGSGENSHRAQIRKPLRQAQLRVPPRMWLQRGTAASGCTA
jgi:hypothetical protein